MKKIVFFGVLLAIAGILATGCTTCQSENKKQGESNYDGVTADFTAGVEHITAMHRETMYDLAKGQKYAWYETKVLFDNEVTAETADKVQVTDVTNIFQLFSPILNYQITTNVEKGTLIPAPVPDIWIEDSDLSDKEVKLTVNNVLKQIKNYDGEIPAGREIILRCPVGPKDCNAQWVLGNMIDALWVDAVTGEISDWCPAFPKPVE